MRPALSRWLRILAMQLRLRPTDVVFVGFDEGFQELAWASHHCLREAAFLDAEAGTDLTVVTRREDEIVLSRRGETGPVAEAVNLTPEQLLCDLVFLLSVTDQEVAWQVPAEFRPGVIYAWRWLWGNEQGAEAGVHFARRTAVRKKQFTGSALGHDSAINHSFPAGFLTLGASEVEYDNGTFSGGSLKVAFDLAAVQRVRRSYLTVIWPPFHGRGLVATKGSTHQPPETPGFVGVEVRQVSADVDERVASCRCHRLGPANRYFAQDPDRNELKIVIDTENLILDPETALELVLRVTPDACLDVFRLSLHLFAA